jgi:RHS repeat-associated protein
MKNWRAKRPLGVSPTTMTYNADGLRVKVQSPGGTLDTIWDGQAPLADAESTNAIRRNATKPTLYGDVIHQFGADPTRFYLYDALGSTIGLMDDDQNLTDSYLYKAYGEVLASSGSTVNPYQWVGRFGYQYDKITNDILQQYVRQRHYLPYTAAWLSQDRLPAVPFKTNLYNYLSSRPTSRIDPSGLKEPSAFDCFCEALAVVDIVTNNALIEVADCICGLITGLTAGEEVSSIDNPAAYWASWFFDCTVGFIFGGVPGAFVDLVAWIWQTGNLEVSRCCQQKLWEIIRP